MSIYLCSNVETLANRIDAENYELAIEAAEMTISCFAEIVDRVYSKFPDLETNDEYDTESNFAAWHSGRFSDQARQYGCWAVGPVAWTVPAEEATAHEFIDEIDTKLSSMLALCLSSYEDQNEHLLS